MNEYVTLSKQQFRFTGKHMLACMIAFFGVIIVVNFTMATMASRTWTGLVVKNPYVAAQGFNQRLEKARAQHAAGYRSEIIYDDGKLTFSLRDGQHSQLAPSEVQVLIGRPAFEQDDATYELTPTSNGPYSANLNLAPGEWQLQVLAGHKAGSYRRDLRLFVDANGKGSVR